MEKYVIDFDKFGLSNELHETNRLIGDIVELVYGCCDDGKYLVTDEDGWMLGYQKNEERYERDELFKLLFELRDINRMLYGHTKRLPTQQEIESSKQRKIEVFDELQKRLKHQPIAFITPTEMIINEQFLQQDQVATEPQQDQVATEPQQDSFVNIDGTLISQSEYFKNQYDYLESDDIDELIERGVDEGIIKENEKIPFKAFAKVWWIDERLKRTFTRGFNDVSLLLYWKVDENGKARFKYNIKVLKCCYAEWRKRHKVKNNNQGQPSTTADNKREKNESSTNNAIITDINIEELENHFLPKFKGQSNNVNLMERLIGELKLLIGTKTDIGRVASLIYNSDYFIKKDYPTFSKWLVDFFRIVGLECPREKSRNKYKPTKRIESIFSFLR